MSEVGRPGECDFLSGGGELGARMRAFDWTTTPLGPPGAWPQQLKSAIALSLGAGAAAPLAEEALRESEATLRAVMEEAPLAIALTGPSGEILLRNPRFDELWGRPAHATTAPTYSDVYEGYHLDGRRIASEEWPGARAVLKGETIENEVYEIVQASGRRIACWFGAAPLRSTSGDIVGAVVVFRDVTDERRVAEALRKANAALAEADRRKDEFIAVLSHELRNPLAPIRYAMPLLAEEPLGERGKRAISVIERQVAHVVRLVDDLLDVSRIATGKIELRRDLFTLGSIVSTAVEAASPAIAAARHSLDIALPDDPIWLQVDPARISQAMTNLLNNSAKYTAQGGRIRIEAAADEENVTIRVIDNGIGLEREALTTVFAMFRQAGDRNGSEGGLGIGLTLAKQLVEMHGGSIEAHSEGKGRGAEFTIRLPRAVATTQRKEQQPPAGKGQLARIKVLVVDDNADLVEMLSMVVEAAGHDVRKAFDGRSGISAALEYQPDLILLDVGMPDMNGTEVAKELRRHQEVAGARIVALTGWGQAEDRQRTADAGFDDHLTKPADPERIQQILEEVAVGGHE
jgi:signal transduction histidine kinase/ActR/RegA family two-component response regulator